MDRTITTRYDVAEHLRTPEEMAKMRIAVELAVKLKYVGMHLTPVATRCSVPAMEEDYPRTLIELEERFSTEAACMEYLRKLRWPNGFICPQCQATGNMEDSQGIVPLRQMWDTNVGDIGNHLARNSQTPANVVSCDVAYNKSEIWRQCSWIETPFGFGKLSYGMAMAS